MICKGCGIRISVDFEEGVQIWALAGERDEHGRQTGEYVKGKTYCVDCAEEVKFEIWTKS